MGDLNVVQPFADGQTYTAAALNNILAALTVKNGSITANKLANNQLVSLADGTSAAPAVSFTQEPGLGLYRHAAGVMGLAGKLRLYQADDDYGWLVETYRGLEAEPLFRWNSVGYLKWRAQGGSEWISLYNSGVGYLAISGGLRLEGDLIVEVGSAPASSSAWGQPGTVVVTTDHLYVCTANNEWKRVALSTW